MIKNSLLTENSVDLSNCDKEPIHIPGRIQPHGILLTLKDTDLEIIQISENIREYRLEPEELLGKSLAQLIPASQFEQLRQSIISHNLKSNPLLISTIDLRERQFEVIAHRYQNVTILELEPSIAESADKAHNFYQLVNAGLAKLQTAATVKEFCQRAAEQVREICGFDRVMLYQYALSINL